MSSMKREDIAAMIESIGLPCTYYQFTDGTQQEPPFICWFFAADSDVKADNENYCDKETLAVELYSKYRDFQQEKAVEDVLTSHGFCYAKQPAFIDSEKLWQIAYESEVFIDGKQQG